MNIQNIVKEIKKEDRYERAQIKKRAEKAIKEIEKLKEDFLNIDENIDKIILFGSLAENSIESIDFDIDLAVRSDKYYQLTAAALKSEFKVDVVDLDNVHERIKQSILKYGKVIYEKRQG